MSTNFNRKKTALNLSDSLSGLIREYVLNSSTALHCCENMFQFIYSFNVSEYNGGTDFAQPEFIQFENFHKINWYYILQYIIRVNLNHSKTKTQSFLKNDTIILFFTKHLLGIGLWIFKDKSSTLF